MLCTTTITTTTTTTNNNNNNNAYNLENQCHTVAPLRQQLFIGEMGMAWLTSWESANQELTNRGTIVNYDC